MRDDEPYPDEEMSRLVKAASEQLVSALPRPLTREEIEMHRECADQRTGLWTRRDVERLLATIDERDRTVALLVEALHTRTGLCRICGQYAGLNYTKGVQGTEHHRDGCAARAALTKARERTT